MMKRATTACSTVGRAVAVEKFIETDEPRTETATRKEKQIELYSSPPRVSTNLHPRPTTTTTTTRTTGSQLASSGGEYLLYGHPIPSLLLLLLLLSEQVSLVPLRSTIGSFLLLVGVDRCPPSFGSY